MTRYSHFEAEDFAQDEFFIHWVNYAEIATEEIWQNWLEIFPHKLEAVRLARQLVLLSSSVDGQEILSQYETSELKKAILSKIDKIDYKAYTFLGTRKWFYIAASILGIAIALNWLVYNRLDKVGMVMSTKSSNKLIFIQNLDRGSKFVNLPDGSSVLLGTNSSISYSGGFSGTSREVYFSGVGFFEISKNPEKPFYVHAHGIVTKVLGTSFQVNAQPDNNLVSIKVKTGRVAIFKDNESEMKLNLKEKTLDGLVLQPNDQIVFEKNNDTFRKIESIKLQREIYSDLNIATMMFEYEEVPISTIFKDLEMAYQMKIVYDSTLMGDCPVTASITDEPLAKKLDLLTKAIRSQYQIVGNTIIVLGIGCK